MKNYLKRERQLDDDLNNFIINNPGMMVQQHTEEATRNVRDRLKSQNDQILHTESKYSVLDEAQEGPLEESTRSGSYFGSKMTSDSVLYGDDNYFGTVGPTDELFSIRDL